MGTDTASKHGRIDISGQRFGRWVALKFERVASKRSCWLCKCDCGTEAIVHTGNLRRGLSTSCGCYGQSLTFTHGMKDTAEYQTWKNIKQRCGNPKNDSYSRYGGRGIKVCDEWVRSFEAFFSEMGRRPTSAHSIDRIDNSRGYEPGNCRWATREEQAANRRPYSEWNVKQRKAGIDRIIERDEAVAAGGR